MGLQVDYTTQKAVAAGAYRRILAIDSNSVDYNPITNNDESWAHGQNQATEQWLEAHDGRIEKSTPAYVQEIGYPLFLNLGDYTVVTPSGGTTSRQHTFRPISPAVTRQGRAVTYAETLGPGWNVLVPRCVADGFTLRGSGLGVLTLDFGMQHSGLINPASTATWTGGTPSVTTPTDRTKFFNTQVALRATPQGESQVNYACRYRSFEVAYRQSLLLEAGYKPGCADFLVAGDPTSGVIRSGLEFDKQTLSFNFNVDMAAGSPELVLVQNQKPIVIVITATGGIIESTIARSLTVNIPVARYKTSKPTIASGIYSFAISGEAMFDYATSKLLDVVLVNTVTSYATGW